MYILINSGCGPSFKYISLKMIPDLQETLQGFYTLSGLIGKVVASHAEVAMSIPC